ncbi:MAG: hypothetical protein HY209_00535 [Candidatus Omnitrophica bacterium]|nr:hypothetical protein [Candidatus Omnitrophota bacterium]
MQLTQSTKNKICSTLVFVPVGMVSLGYVLLKRDFAKIYVDLSFLDFPVFIGEVLLLSYVLLLALRWSRQPPLHNRFYMFVLVYFIWVAVKIVIGYRTWGPLALRHAALFYYPFFFLVGYIFFNRDAFTKPVILSLFSVIIGIFLYGHYDIYWTFTLASLGLILILGVKAKKWIVPMVLILVLATPYVFLFKTARMMFVANTASLLFLIGSLWYLLETKRYVKIITVVILMVGLSIGFYKFFVLRESGRIFVSPSQVVSQFIAIDKDVQQKRKNFQIQSQRVGLYHPEAYAARNYYYYNKGFKQSKERGLESAKKLLMKGKVVKGVVMTKEMSIQWESIENILFRLFIWRDMFEDWKATKPLMGVDFGKPFRSVSLEVEGWAVSEWGRDGWIEPHNSFLNMMYRGGMVGAAVVVVIWTALIRLMIFAFRQRAWVLILLSAILLNWLVAANFLLILEFPYTAIPLWTLAGMTWAYAYRDYREGSHEIKR